MKTASEEVRNQKFFLDTCASTHICPHTEQFDNISACSGSVISCLGETMEVLGKGTVILNCIINNKTINKFILHDVLVECNHISDKL